MLARRSIKTSVAGISRRSRESYQTLLAYTPDMTAVYAFGQMFG